MSSVAAFRQGRWRGSRTAIATDVAGVVHIIHEREVQAAGQNIAGGIGGIAADGRDDFARLQLFQCLGKIALIRIAGIDVG